MVETHAARRTKLAGQAEADKQPLKAKLASLAVGVAWVALVILKPFDFVGWSHCLGMAGFALAIAIVALFLLARADRKRLRAMSTPELERRVWYFPAEYFDFIGQSHPAVAEFRRIVEARDLVALQRSWPALETAFLRIELAAGSRGRPLVMDYYHGFTSTIAELARRSAT